MNGTAVVARCGKFVTTILAVLATSPLFGFDVDVTFIDRLPNYSIHAPKNQPANGDRVTFVGHVKLRDSSSPILAYYVWYLDGLEIAQGDQTLLPGQDNTVSVDWIWDDARHEIMLVFDPANLLLEESEENNIVFDFTDALIVGIAVEQGLVDAFPAFQRPLGIGSVSFENWVQRQIRIWNLTFMTLAGELRSPETVDIRDRVRGLISYHSDETLGSGNCPRVWDEVDMIWGKLTSDIPAYESWPLFWFYEGSLIHELTHARGLPDTYILDLGAHQVHIVDDDGLPVTETDYMPKFSWDVVYYNKNRGIMGAGSERYSLFLGNLWNRRAGLRSPGCNGNGCCLHDSRNDWSDDLPAQMYLKVLDLNSGPWVGARLDIYQRVGHYCSPCDVDNVIDFTLYTDTQGRAALPRAVFTPQSYEFVLKITAPSGGLREYRFVERTDFHNAFWAGQEASWDYVIQTDFDPVPVAEMVLGDDDHSRGETFDVTFQGRNLQTFSRYGCEADGVTLEGVGYVDPTEASVTVKLPRDLRTRGFACTPYNPDRKFVRIVDAYSQGITRSWADDGPTARFVLYSLESSVLRSVYFNGLWSDDWSRVFGENQSFPQPGAGPLASYYWDFGDGSQSSGAFVTHQFPAPGQYSVSLTVTDQDGLTDTVTQAVVVRLLFTDAFESGDTSAWSGTVP